MDPSIELNSAFWDERAAAHAASPDYAVDRFVAEPDFLSYVVQFDRPRLGDLTGLDLVHLQCHIGTDTISLGRLGARVTGLDLSQPALAEARRIAAAAGVEATFVRSEVYDAVDALGAGSFDMVFTGVGALCWLPDIRRWAKVVSALLRPGGRLHIREGHPVLWSLDEMGDDERLTLGHPYFEMSDASVWGEGEEGTTYVQTDQVFTSNVTHEWNHGLGEIVTALLEADMVLTMLEEHDSVPWEALPGHMTLLEGGEWRLTDRPERLPHSYTLQARRRGVSE
jgi:SAM-dependent methyltransferase